ncbi:erythroid differentiation-related factor 1 [Malaya genurostris]|uniref:erythroid differentiation-related factor 1 n=1 Tax=Malaya genurostris TaxID=325434 RepID=UPI0026F3AA22|nr:erythroid differentiation-related factor 1 [Malaya genurostris]
MDETGGACLSLSDLPEQSQLAESLEKEQVKSNAIVRFLNVQSVAPFARLKCNTDLNLPPSNWLSNSANSYGLGQSLSHQRGFSSFRMANMFPDCVGGVDVVSDAENIKRLLKLPYSRKSVVSMIVHRIENTLLIDEFDVARYLLRQEDSDWHWLRSFIYENILNSLSDSEKKLFIHTKSREALAQKYLTSKFLYYSLKSDIELGEEDTDSVDDNGDNCQQFKPLPLAGPVLPEPDEEENFPDPRQTSHVFNRNVVWTFEDIRMLIGTDMPIFGGTNRPCISLRLRDESKPINVLTGIDYWLDNLMCNVPEVVMCYHLDGIVQRYELIKTEDLPHLEDSKFSPKVIRNVAQNILVFLKANATKAGHTYWLFKAKNDDVVKLYDLTTLCQKHSDCQPESEAETEDESLKNENPFTIPVAMLLYTVARNMKNAREGVSATKAGAIKMLLDNCIKLLPKEKYPQIVTSSHYILSDLYIPVDTDPGSPKFNTMLDDEDDADDDDDEFQSIFGEHITNSDSPQSDEYVDDRHAGSNRVQAAIKSIEETLQEYNGSDGWRYNSRPPPLVGNIEERCTIALQHIADGLSCLQYFDSSEEQKCREKEQAEEKRKIYHEETHPNMAKSDDPIPLPYSPLHPEPVMAKPNEPIAMGWKPDSDVGQSNDSCRKTSKKKTKKKIEKKRIPEEETTSETDARSLLLKGATGVIKSWNVHLKILLFEKACLTYATLAEHCYALEEYGRSLRYIYSAVRCQQVVTKYISCVSSQRGLLLGRIGDCFFQLAKKWDNIKQYLKEFDQETRIDQLIMDELVKDIGSEVEQSLPLPMDNIEQLMITSCGCYEAAIACASKDAKAELNRRLGSVRNELGVKYMHWAQDEYHKFWDLPVEKREAFGKAAKELDSASEPIYQILAKKAYDSLYRGVSLFEAVNDSTNLAFLLCNMGRFMRFRAHIHFVGESPNNVHLQKKFYKEAFTHYQRALGVLGSKKENPDLWSLVTWELSTATFNLAKQLQDCSDVDHDDSQSVEEVEQEVVEMLQKALKLCDQELNGPRQVLYSFRAALIHHRIASYYHFSFRNASEEHRRKTILQLCKLHYEKAVKIFESLNEPQEFLQIQMERIALQEYQCELIQTIPAKLRILQQALLLCMQSQAMIEYLCTAKSLVNAANSNLNCEEIQKLLELFEKRLQVILKTLAKLCLLSAGSKKGDSDRLATQYKAMFGLTLQKRTSGNAVEDETSAGGDSSSNVVREHALYLVNMLRNICDLDKTNG